MEITTIKSGYYPCVYLVTFDFYRLNSNGFGEPYLLNLIFRTDKL